MGIMQSNSENSEKILIIIVCSLLPVQDPILLTEHVGKQRTSLHF